MAVGTMIQQEGAFGMETATRTAAIIFVVKIIVVDWKRNYKFSKIENDFFDTVFMNTFLLFFNFENVLFSNLKIKLYENAAKNSKMFS